MNFFLASTIDDDYLPFRQKGLDRIFHVIDTPYPSVWHTVEDNYSALDMRYVYRFAQLLRVWLAQYLRYKP